MVKPKKETYICGLELTTEILGGKWKMMLLWYLRNKSLRFGQLKRCLNGITEKVLSHELKELTELGLIDRKVYYQTPLKVEYSLTSYGKTFLPILYSTFEWGTAYAKTFNVKLQINDLTIDKVLSEKRKLSQKNAENN